MPLLNIELYYPLAGGRAGFDPRPDPSYSSILSSFVQQNRTQTILTLEPFEGSRWWDVDYVLWNQWKRNYIEAVKAHPDFVLREEVDFESAEVRVSLFSVISEEITYQEGWARPEPWGRWIVGNPARMQISANSERTHLVVTTASHPSQDRPQSCRVVVNGALSGTFQVATAPWSWTEYAVPLPLDPTCRVWDVEIRCDYSSRASPTDRRLVFSPVKRVFLR